ncbi:carbon monoxide dehydrogenase subunit G [Paraburkholderia sp. BL10I2N1]|uniref:CoxG family protein n=1 Tax=Paraburkholderia sp. BL10I2N1 TaxID=1938796 RepID=UPI00105EB9AF|nr:carbon monoxide dehydrogenase subunit G [Paraburkholderia sp. BL10I2N1]TDN62401.1 hypothetical protein B0G77_5968 [Paraburkholderia sp. BL10I2N1]
MEIKGNRAFTVTREHAWRALNDPLVLEACIPGCDKVEPIDENRYQIGLTVRIGAVATRFKGNITLTDMGPPHSYTIRFEGQGGHAGFAKGDARVSLAPQGAGCELTYAAQAQVGGKITQAGHRLIDGVARSMVNDFFRRFEAQMQRQDAEIRTASTEVPLEAQGRARERVADGSSRGTTALWTWIGVPVFGGAAAGLIHLH